VVKYVSKREMLFRFKGDYFGYTVFRNKNIYIRYDILNDEYFPTFNRWLQESLLGHEQHHATYGDRGGFIYNEVPAWWAGFKAQPVGWLLSIVMSLRPSRLGLYFLK